MLVSPHLFYRVAGWLIPRFAAAAVLIGALGIFLEIAVAAPKVQPSAAAHIVFIHESVAWMSLVVLFWMGFWGGVWLAFGWRLSRVLVFSLAPTGTLFAFLALWTGALWGRPVWGTWWLWEARLTSELIVLLLCAAVIGLQAFLLDASKADRIASVVSLAGIVVVPLLYCGVYWATAAGKHPFVGLTGRPPFSVSALTAVAAMTLSLWMYTFAMSFARARTIILERERDSDWAERVVGANR